ncbi:MAG: hypothetical protein JO125_16020 [Chloroflexi bacterium]|nr:hypothetical protein [Ktedonobacteraceae bacterium]MBV9708902.1 hypothetical protein [Chloroflexota bacterium]
MPEKKSPRRKLILLAESNQAHAVLLISILAQQTAHHAVVITTGQHTIHILTKLIPDLLIFPEHLVDMSGMQLYKQIQTVEKLRPLPLLMLRAHTTIHRSKFICLGTPFDLEEFLHAVEALLPDTPF